MDHPCLRCGACCAAWRVSFYFGECHGEGGVPPDLTTPISPFRVAMVGTEAAPWRCVALEGEVGAAVRCAIWPRRSSTCRAFAASYADGARDERCDDARARHGLPPLTPEDWLRASPPSGPPDPGTPPAGDRR